MTVQEPSHWLAAGLGAVNVEHVDPVALLDCPVAPPPEYVGAGAETEVEIEGLVVVGARGTGVPVGTIDWLYI